MVRVLVDAEFVVLLGDLGIVGQEVQSLSISKIGWDGLWIELSGVFKVFDSLLILFEFTK